MKNGSSLTMEDNNSAGIFLYGGNVDVQDGTTLTITGTGKDLDNTDDRSVGALPHIITTIPMPQTSPLLTVHR